jgi:hypothetical protein
MALSRITSDSVASNAITSLGVANGAIVTVDLADSSVTGPKLGIGSISANNFAFGGVTSNVLASNLSISLTRAIESANINTIAPNGNVDIDIANNVVYYFNANSTANITFNLRANTQNTFDSVTTIGQSATLAMVVNHGTGRHSANLQIDGALQTPVYAGNTKPVYQVITNQETNIFSYTVMKLAANSYAVFASNSLFGLG